MMIRMIIRLCFTIFVMLAGEFCQAEQAEPIAEDYITTYQQRFEATKPTVCMHYKVSYRFMGLNLLSIAEANMEATEGLWTKKDGQRIPSCYIHIHLKSAHDEPREKSRIFLNDHMMSMVTMPELKTIYYMKTTDERLKPFRKKTERLSFSVYDLEDGALEFIQRDLLANTTQTNINGAADMAAQGDEVAEIISMLSDIYHGRKEMLTPKSDFRINVNCDGQAVPFAAKTKRNKLKLMKKKWPALYMEVEAGKEAPKDVKTREFSLWATSFTEAAARSDDPILVRLAEETPAWGMTPLLANYELPLGHIRCTLKKITSRDDEGLYENVKVELTATEKPSSEATKL